MMRTGSWLLSWVKDLKSEGQFKSLGCLALPPTRNAAPNAKSTPIVSPGWWWLLLLLPDDNEELGVLSTIRIEVYLEKEKDYGWIWLFKWRDRNSGECTQIQTRIPEQKNSLQAALIFVGPTRLFWAFFKNESEDWILLRLSRLKLKSR